jgi:serine/threonine protein kinase
MKIQNALL